MPVPGRGCPRLALGGGWACWLPDCMDVDMRWSVGRRLRWSPLVDDALPSARPLSRDSRPVRARAGIKGGIAAMADALTGPRIDLAVRWTVGEGADGEH